MKITFVSNYINHHQIPFCNALTAINDVEFCFIQTEKMEEERVAMGWSLDSKQLAYVLYAYETPDECQRIILESDVVIWGGAEDETMLKPRLDARKLVFRYSERLYRTGLWRAVSPRGLWKKYHDHTKFRKCPVYLLCAGAYVAYDFSIIKAYPGKMLKWGYFPETKNYDIDALISEKLGVKGIKERKKEILWAARFIECKHPEVVVQLVERLAEKREDFHVTMIGGGELEPMTRMLIEDKGLQDKIDLVGYKTPQEVRKYMEKADIYLVTSDRIEGWGAVLNEAMNSACAVISSHMIGAAPFLIEHGRNGLMYREGNLQDLQDAVNVLLDDDERRIEIGKAAYRTIVDEWNAEEAAKRFAELAKDLLQNKEFHFKWESGPGSRAKILREGRRVPQNV